MKKVTVKQQLVDYMIAAGNPGFTYTEVVKAILKIKFGADFKYDRSYRGYYSCAISGINNYFMNGSGKCGLYKLEGKYYAAYFEKNARKYRAVKAFNRKLEYAASPWYNSFGPRFQSNLVKLTNGLVETLRRIEKESASQSSSY